MGKNMTGKVPRNMAKLLKKENAKTFTFYSLQMSSATAAAEK